MKYDNEQFAQILFLNRNANSTDTVLYVKKISPGNLAIDLLKGDVSIHDTESDYIEIFDDNDSTVKVRLGKTKSSITYNWHFKPDQELVIMEYDATNKFIKYQRWQNGSGSMGINIPDLSKSFLLD